MIGPADPRDTLSQRLRDILASHPNVREVRMFGVQSFMVDGRLAVAADRDGGLLVRTDPADHDDLLRRGALPAQMGGDRPMGRGWLTVPSVRISDEADLAFWVQVGIDSRSGQG
ncbi:TfoX/Sxy family protein [Arthrobacter antioxidans]|uniref:TfoX/Sxy family protein n=1 Tax=Arthrobacter antioxidans TaxID=2895818 RepID=UPI0022A99EE9|nr:TfoX/Sxy family protein [Arthrobacter antioxidans]